MFFAHPAFSTCGQMSKVIAVASLKEIGLEDGGTLNEIRNYVTASGYQLCPMSTGLFLRIAWTDQPESINAVLSGTHSAPDGSVTVLSENPETDDAFPKGLYLRNVEGQLWLRGYVCDQDYRFSGSDLFAFDASGKTGNKAFF